MAEATHDINVTLSHRVRALRLSKNLSVEDVAKRMRETTHFVSRIENGNSVLSAAQLVSIARALGVLVSVVVGDIPANQKEPVDG